MKFHVQKGENDFSSLGWGKRGGQNYSKILGGDQSLTHCELSTQMHNSSFILCQKSICRNTTLERRCRNSKYCIMNFKQIKSKQLYSENCTYHQLWLRQIINNHWWALLKTRHNKQNEVKKTYFMYSPTVPSSIKWGNWIWNSCLSNV